MSFVGPGPGGWREEAFPAFEETVTRSQQQRTDWVLRVLSDPHKYALSVGSDDQPYPLSLSPHPHIPIMFHAHHTDSWQKYRTTQVSLDKGHLLHSHSQVNS